MSRHTTSSLDEELATAALTGLVLVALVGLLLAAYGAVKAVNLVVRSLAHHPRNRALWIALTCCLGSWLVLGLAATLLVASSVLAVLGGLAVASTAALLLVAHIVEVYYAGVFQRARTRDTLLADVLNRPWWEAAA